eukprot:IDg14607t1
MRSCALGKQVSRVVAGARSEATVDDGPSSSGKEEACRQWVPGGHGCQTIRTTAAYVRAICSECACACMGRIVRRLTRAEARLLTGLPRLARVVESRQQVQR